MLEYTTTNTNPFIDLSHRVWGWEIPVYLFLGGLVAGMMAISGYFLFTGRWREANCSCYALPGLGLFLLSLGMLALFLDLEHKPYFWRLYMTFEPRSPMSWGSWILVLVYPALLASLALRPPGWLRQRLAGLEQRSDRLMARPALVRWIGAANAALGVLLGIYTGILLGSLGARPLWSSALLGPLFLVSGLSTAAAFVHLVARNRSEREMLARADIGFLATELLFIGLFLIGLLSASRAHMAAADLLLGGPFSAVFWVFVVGLGVVVPIIVQSLAVTHRIGHTPVAPILVISGGFVLRLVIVYAGQLSGWAPV
jgi:formate-dependent nitrite reductase membrane component NrfD